MEITKLNNILISMTYISDMLDKNIEELEEIINPQNTIEELRLAFKEQAYYEQMAKESSIK